MILKLVSGILFHFGDYMAMNKLDQKLFDALGTNDIDGAEQLLRNGANVNAKNHLGQTPLIRFAYSSIIIDMLLKHNPDKDERDCNGYTALQYGTYYGDQYIMRSLLTHGASPDIQDNRGWTPLIEAIEKNDVAAVKILLERNADVSLKTKDGQTAIDIAKENGYNSIIGLLDHCQENRVLMVTIEACPDGQTEKLDF